MNEVSIELKTELTEVERQAALVSITSQEDYTKAGELTKRIKKAQTKVKDFWEPMRVSAKKAYDDVLDHKKSMLDPLEKAEKVLKGKMSEFLLAVERERKRKEEEMRKAAEAEMLKKLAEAEELEKSGDDFGADFAMAEAEMMDTAARTMVVKKPDMKMDGVSTVKSWEIVSIDPGKVPISVNGFELRPVDEGAVKRLVKATGGKVEIPGVVFRETVTMRVGGR